MSHSGKEAIGVGGEVYPGDGGLQIEHSANKGGVLVGKAVVLLSGPSAGFNVVDGRNITAPWHFSALVRKVNKGVKYKLLPVYIPFS